MDHNKIINRINIKEANEIDTTEELGELIEAYTEKCPLPTKEEIEKEENELVLSLINEPLSPFYLEFCNQEIRMLNIIYPQLINSWKLLQKEPKNLQKATSFYTSILKFDYLCGIFLTRVEKFFGFKDYIESPSPLNEFMVTFNDSYTSFTNSLEYIEFLKYLMNYCELLFHELITHILDTDYEYYGNLYHYCAFSFHPAYIAEVFLRTLKKEME